MRELERRGFDAESTVREGLGDDIASAICIGHMLGQLPSTKGRVPRPPEGWTGLLAPIGDDSRLLNAGIAYSADVFRVMAWARNAAIAEIIAWTPPSAEQFKALSAHPNFAHGIYRWIVDRSLQTYLEDWRTESLHFEWRYLRGETPAPCPTLEMRCRRVGEAQLSLLIADRAVRNEATRPPLPLDRYVRIALELLEEGQRARASELFEAITEVDPDHGRALNNYAFCVLPDAPEAALSALDRASRLGLEWDPFVVANRVLGLLLLGKLTAALDLADRFYERYSDICWSSGWLWQIEIPLADPKIVEVEDARIYVVEAAVCGARASGDPALTKTWEARLAEVHGTG
jgi:hypothetical protein